MMGLYQLPSLTPSVLSPLHFSFFSCSYNTLRRMNLREIGFFFSGLQFKCTVYHGEEIKAA